MSNETISDRAGWIDFIKAVAIFMVVWLHSAASWFYKFSQVSSFNWQIANIAESTVRVAVPLFFMATGYLLLNSPAVLRPYFQKRFNRILLPWISWSFIYLLYAKFHNGSDLGFFDALCAFFNAKVYYHLWYLYALIGIYLMLPIISWFAEADREKRLLYFLGLWFVATSVMPFFEMALTYTTGFKVQYGSALNLALFSGFSGYIVAGALIGKYNVSKLLMVLCPLTYGLCVIFTIVATTIATGRSGRFVEYFYGYTTPNVVIASFAAFAYLRGLGQVVCRNPIASSTVKRISNASLGIYLIHIMFIDAIYDGELGAFFASVSKNTALSIPLVAIVGFFLSYTTVEIILRVPGIRRIV